MKPQPAAVAFGLSPIAMPRRAPRTRHRRAVARPAARRRRGHARADWLILLGLAIFLQPARNVAFGANEWLTPEAPVRIIARVAEAPSAPSAGVLLVVPNGGALPSGRNGARAFTQSGEPLASEVVWDNPDEGFGIVVGVPPANESVSVYIGSTLPARGDDAALRPSLLLFTAADRGGLSAAAALAKPAGHGRDVRMTAVERIGQMENPLGPDDHYISYYRGWIKLDKPDRVYFATISDEGSRVLIDGRTVADWPGRHTREAGQRGEFGDWIDLAAGYHHIEYHHFEEEGAQECTLAWKRGPSSALPSIVEAGNFLHSGRLRIEGVEARDGRALPLISWACSSYMWLAKRPVVLYAMRPAYLVPTNTPTAWSVDNSDWLAEPEMSWLFEGNEEHRVALRVGLERSAAAVPLYAGASKPRAASTQNVQDRRSYREALYRMCRAMPAARDPCAAWTEDFWQIAVMTSEPLKGKGLLDEICTRGLPSLRKRPEQERARLFLYYWEMQRLLDAQGAVAWLNQMLTGEPSRRIRFDFQIRLAEFHLYDLADAGRASTTVEAARGAVDGAAAISRCQVLLADIDLAQGRYDEAAAGYAEAEAAFRRAKSVERQGGATRTMGDWRTQAVRSASYFSEFQSLLRQGFLLEARRKLDEWTAEFPTCRLDGRLPVAEAMYYDRMGDGGRVARVLQAYYRHAELSPEFPRALDLAVRALEARGDLAGLAEVSRIIEDRLPNHPLAERAASLEKRHAAEFARIRAASAQETP
jgi:tetratricopeptide (TPR) repeat protein